MRDQHKENEEIVELIKKVMLLEHSLKTETHRLKEAIGHGDAKLREKDYVKIQLGKASMLKEEHIIKYFP